MGVRGRKSSGLGVSRRPRRPIAFDLGNPVEYRPDEKQVFSIADDGLPRTSDRKKVELKDGFPVERLPFVDAWRHVREF